MNDTRNCRIEPIKSILENLSTVIETLLDIDQTDMYSSSEASLLLHCIQDCVFILLSSFKRNFRLNQFIEFILAITNK